MCGIIGLLAKSTSGGFSATETRAFSDLMYMNTLRGFDSSGIIHVDDEGNVDVVKDVIPGTYFTGIKEYDEVVEKKSFKHGKVLIGHNRKATIGKVNVENAHPFIVNNELVLVHNGSLTSHKNLADIESDSHAIAIHLHKNYQEELGKAFAEINGAYALVWYDVRTNRLNLVRNSQRPLWMCETSQAWWWASEPHMLWAALDRNNLRALKDSMKQLDSNKLYSLNLDTMHFNSKFEETTIPFVSPPSKTTGDIQDTTKTNIVQLTECTGGTKSISKNKFKDAVYTKFTGKVIDFIAEDFVDINDKGENYYFYGTSYELGDIKHDIVGECSEVTATAILDANGFASGMVVNSYYDKTEKKAVLKVIPSVRRIVSNESQTCH
jgi:glucosamine 6-phosphate synthetase-like amidotransferase/phosphosugar isomerase protein